MLTLREILVFEYCHKAEIEGDSSISDKAQYATIEGDVSISIKSP